MDTPLLQQPFTRIEIRGLELDIKLGWPEWERANTQKVMVDLLLRFPKPPKACVNDDLQDTYCYKTMAEEIQRHTQHREFKLIEYLGHDIYDLIKKIIAPSVLLSVKVFKKPPIQNLNGGVHFSMSDEREPW